MAASTVMASSTSRNMDLQRRSSSSASTKSSSIPDLHNFINHQPLPPQQNKIYDNSSQNLASNSMSVNQAAESTLLKAEITLLDAAGAVTAIGDNEVGNAGGVKKKTVDDVWKEIVAGRREFKKEAPDELMTLEDFLVKAGAAEAEPDVKLEPERLSGGIFPFDRMSLSPFPSQRSGDWSGSEVTGGRGKRRALLEPLDRAAEQRQRRMIKNRESAARSRERKQAYQVELESLAVKLEEENEKLLEEKAARTKERLKQLMERIVPVVENRRPPRFLRRIHSTQW